MKIPIRKTTESTRESWERTDFEVSSVPHNGGKSPIPMQACKIRHTADDSCTMHKG
jgi:hypothetical protein